MRCIYSIFIIIAGTILACSCSYKQSHILFEKKQNTGMNSDSADRSPAIKYIYRIQPRDILQIRNLQNIKYIVDELPATAGASGGGSSSAGQTYEVEEDGTVVLPAIGHVPVSGLTRTEAAKKIEGLYRKDLLVNPIIELKITNLKVTVLGEVGSQGNFPLLKDNTTLVEMLGQAGGLTANANEQDVKIIRGTGLEKSVTKIDLGDIRSVNDPRAVLQNGDVVYIGQNKKAIRNDKLQNFNAIIQPALVLLSTALIIISLTR